MKNTINIDKKIKLQDKVLKDKYNVLIKLLIKITGDYYSAIDVIDNIISNYPERTKCVLRGEMQEIDKGYMNAQKNKIVKIDEKRNHNDYRKPLIIGQTLAFNWIVEDVVKFYLEKNSCNILKSDAADADRLLVHHSQLTNDADLKIEKNGKIYEVEIASSFKDFTTKTDSIDLREVKFPNLLKKHNKGQNMALLVIDFYTMEIRLIRINNNTKYKFIPGDKSKKGILAKDRYNIDLPKESIREIISIKKKVS